MAPFRPRSSGHAAVAGLALLTALVATPRAMAQHTPDPYNYVGEYNRGYEPYMYPSLPNDQGVIPGQAALMGRTGIGQANQYRSYINELDGGEGEGGILGSSRGLRFGPGVPYYNAYRQYDRDYGRFYAPNQAADRTYYEEQKARHDKHLQYQEAAREKYAQYVRETDPTRRAKLYRDYLNLDQRATLEGGTSRGLLPQARRTTPASSSTDLPSATSPRTRAPAPGVSPRGTLSPSTPSPTPDRGARSGPVRPSPSHPPLPAELDPLAPSSRTPRSNSEILRRSELMERGARGTAPGTTRNPARQPPSAPASR